MSQQHHRNRPGHHNRDARAPVEEPARPESFSFLKGSEDVVALRGPKPFDWTPATALVRQNLADAFNATHISFLLGSGCSSFVKDGVECGIPTMGPMASEFIAKVGPVDDPQFITEVERKLLLDVLGLDVTADEYKRNLERLMEVLLGFEHVLARSARAELKDMRAVVASLIAKVTHHVRLKCIRGRFIDGDDTVLGLYQAFYRKLVYRDRSLPKPWVFTTNYDLFNETAMDRLSIPYANGFSGSVERRFNPSVFRYALAEQLDVSSRKWSSVDNFVYLCKLHGSVNWIEDAQGLFPIREISADSALADRIMIYPTPTKQSTSFGSPYSDLFREFQHRIVRDQSVLVVLGYSFSDEHVNNIIFQALTVPNFRLVLFAPPDAGGTIGKLRALGDPRIWIIGGPGPAVGRSAHYFNTFVEHFMPEPPGDRVDEAVKKVLDTLIARPPAAAKDQ